LVISQKAKWAIVFLLNRPANLPGNRRKKGKERVPGIERGGGKEEKLSGRRESNPRM
jgi:hypothetical protein